MTIAYATAEFALIEKLILGDEIAFRDLYKIHHDTVFMFALHLTKSRERAKEITQEVFITIWEKRVQINGEMNFKGYLKRITLNFVINFLKKASRDKKLQQEIFDNMKVLQQNATEILQEKQLAKIYHEAVCRLPPQKKIIYQLSRNNDFSYTQIAEQLHLSRSTVKNHMIEALKIIRRRVSSQLF